MTKAKGNTQGAEPWKGGRSHEVEGEGRIRYGKTAKGTQRRIRQNKSRKQEEVDRPSGGGKNPQIKFGLMGACVKETV